MKSYVEKLRECSVKELTEKIAKKTTPQPKIPAKKTTEPKTEKPVKETKKQEKFEFMLDFD